MPTPFGPMKQVVIEQSPLGYGWGGSGMRAGGLCSHRKHCGARAIPGSAAEVEVHRLAKTRLQLAALHFEEGRAEVALGEVAQALQAYPAMWMPITSKAGFT